MDAAIAETLSKKIQISKDHLVREEYEMIFLKEIGESAFSSNLVFKGGTALRLAYNSPRFSEDLDFSLVGESSTTKLLSFLTKVGKKYPGIVGVESIEKFYTVFVLVKIDVGYIRPFSIKIEISKRSNTWAKGVDYKDKLIRSEVVPLTALMMVASVEVIKHEKEDALKNRQVARDVFDYWYINQLLKKEIKPDFSGYEEVAAKSELHKFLPRAYWRLVDTWLE